MLYCVKQQKPQSQLATSENVQNIFLKQVPQTSWMILYVQTKTTHRAQVRARARQRHTMWVSSFMMGCPLVQDTWELGKRYHSCCCCITLYAGSPWVGCVRLGTKGGGGGGGAGTMCKSYDFIKDTHDIWCSLCWAPEISNIVQFHPSTTELHRI